MTTNKNELTNDAAADLPLPRFIRFADIRAAGISDSRTHLDRMIREDGFPPGRMISPNVRAWLVSEVTAWLEARPTDPKKVMPYKLRKPAKRPKQKAAAKRKAATSEHAGETA